MRKCDLLGIMSQCGGGADGDNANAMSRLSIVNGKKNAGFLAR